MRLNISCAASSESTAEKTRKPYNWMRWGAWEIHTKEINTNSIPLQVLNVTVTIVTTQAPFRHIIFKKQHDNLTTFQLFLFHSRYHKNVTVGPSENLNPFVQSDSLHAEYPELYLTDDDEG